MGAQTLPEDTPEPTEERAKGMSRLVVGRVGLPPAEAELGDWLDLNERMQQSEEVVEIALVGKYVKLQDAYLSVHEALKHAGAHHGANVRVSWVDAEGMSLEEATGMLEQVDGVL